MFDFFRDIMLETRGIDAASAQVQRIQKKKDRDKDKYILSYSFKRIIYIIGIMFLVTSIALVPVVMMDDNLFYKIRLLLQLLLDIGIMICISLKKRRKVGEWLAIVMIVLFFALQYSTLVLEMAM